MFLMERTPDRSTSEQSEEALIVDTVLMKYNRPVIGEGSAGASSLLSEENLEWHNATHRKVGKMVQIQCSIWTDVVRGTNV